MVYGYNLVYKSKPDWEIYEGLLNFARQIEHDAARLKPVDLIDIQSFIWVLGSSEYD
jgi:hypothetical protein